VKKAIVAASVFALVLMAYAVAAETPSAETPAASPAVEPAAAPAAESTAEAVEAEQPGESVQIPGIQTPVEPLPADSPLKTLKDKVSYGIGLNIGKNFKAQDVDLNVDFVAQGMKDSIAGSKPLMNDKQVEAAMNEFQKEYTAHREEVKTKQAEVNTKAGEAFLAENGKKPGVTTLPDGMQYQVITEGAGEKPKATDTVKVNYKGTLLDGKEFDSSEKNGGPVTFALNQVIPGWTEALQLMKVGAKYRFWIPAKLAYGAQGCPPVIEPNATLTFEIELISIEKPAKGQGPDMSVFEQGGGAEKKK
jgi:FKBP-type peptidyl-prolyl cis-trans isomerase